jgi:hypothetical protein
MNATSVLRNQTSIVRHILLGKANSTMRAAIQALELQAILFARITVQVADRGEVAGLARIGNLAADEAVIDCLEHADAGDVIGAVDCLVRVQSGHRTAKSLLSAIAEIGDTEVAEQAQLGINLAMAVLDDLGSQS